MKFIIAVGLAVALAVQASTPLSAEELVSGPQAGERVTALLFDISAVKCGGAKDRYPVGTSPRYY